MNHSLIHKFLGLTLIVGVLVALVTPSHAAERTRSRSGSYTAGPGQSGTFNSTTTRGEGIRQREATRTNQDGATATRSSARTWDRATGTCTRTVEIAKPDGTTKTRTQSFTIVKEPTPSP